ncbi:MAG: Uma2 family endonuclease [Proteobacteria bacterium]|nr:Uma2 family endonuclease [Pseudomonadota bacterium]
MSIEPRADRVVMQGVTWDRFESYLAERGDAGPRVTYLEGMLELVSPSRDHETIKKRFAEVVEAYLDHLGIEWEGVGSWLLKRAPAQAGLEPDECYLLGDVTKDRPDLAIEVVWTSGGIDKLEVYRRLGIAEVWFWIEGSVAVYVLDDAGFARRATSACLPGFDFAIVGEMLALASLSAVRRALRTRFG